MNSTDLTLKKMFDSSAKLVGEQEEINNVDKFHWKNHSWKQLSLIGDETVINLQSTKVYVFSDSVLCLGKIHSHPESNEAWKKRIEWIIIFSKATETLTESVESRHNSSGTSSQDSIRCSSAVKSQIYWADWEKHEKLSLEEFSLCRCSTTFLVTVKAMKKNVWQMQKSSPYLQRKFGIGQWSFIGPGSEKKWYSMEENKSTKGIWDHIPDKMLLEFAESGCPFFRATTPLSRSNLKSKGHGKLSIQFASDYPTIETIFRIIVFANQLSLYGAVANMCEEFESHQDRSRTTWCIDGTIKCSQWNQGRSFFGKWHPITRESSIATISRTNQIAFTRKQSE